MHKFNAKLPIAAVVCTLNEKRRELRKSLQSVLEAGVTELIVVDGGSEDDTASIVSSLTTKLYVTSPSIARQSLLGFEKAESEYIFSFETDHHVDRDLVGSLYKRLKKSDCAGIQAKLVCLHKNSFFEKGQAIFYELNQGNSEYIEVPTAPALWVKSKILPVMRELETIEAAAGFSIDTVRSDILKTRGLKVLSSDDIAYQVEKLDFAQYRKKIMGYGVGDYHYYKANASTWNYARKLKSLTHVFRKYCIYLPVRSLLRTDFYIALPFFWITAALRYFGFLAALIKSPARK